VYAPLFLVFEVPKMIILDEIDSEIVTVMHSPPDFGSLLYMSVFSWKFPLIEWK